MTWPREQDRSETEGRGMIFSLRDEEAYLKVTDDTTAEPASKARSKSRKTKQTKKIKKARSVKAPNKQTESQAVQSERVEEFFLH